MAIENIVKRMDRISRVLDRKVMVAMDLTGQEFVKNAGESVTESIYERITGRTPNRRPWELTGNLRSSIEANPKKSGDTMSLELSAGMEYAAAVEARGYDVISGSIPKAKRDFDRRLELSLKASRLEK